MAAIIEFRTYTTKDGERAAVIELLEDRFFAEMERLGIKALGCYPSVEDENILVWLRAFPDATAHEQLTKELYGGALWKEELEQPIVSRIASISVTTVEDTSGLWDAWPDGAR